MDNKKVALVILVLILLYTLFKHNKKNETKPMKIDTSVTHPASVCKLK